MIQHIMHGHAIPSAYFAAQEEWGYTNLSVPQKLRKDTHDNMPGNDNMAATALKYGC